MMKVTCFFSSKKDTGPTIVAWFDTLASVLIELLPSLTPSEGLILLNAGIRYFQHSSNEAQQGLITRLEESISLINELCAAPLIPRINPELFRAYANQVTSWINEQFLDDEHLLDSVLQAFDDLYAHRRYAGSTPACIT